MQWTCWTTGSWRCCLSLEVVISIPAGSTIIYRFLCRLICVSLYQSIKIKPINMYVTLVINVLTSTLTPYCFSQVIVSYLETVRYLSKWQPMFKWVAMIWKRWLRLEHTTWLVIFQRNKPLFRRKSKKISKLHVTGLCEGDSPGTGEFPTQRVSNAEMFSFDDVSYRSLSTLVRVMACRLPGAKPLCKLTYCQLDYKEHISIKFYLKFNGFQLRMSVKCRPFCRRVAQICVSKLTIVGSDNGLSPGRRQAIIWTNVGILLIGPLGTNFSEILMGIHKFSSKIMHLKMSSVKCRSFCLAFNVLTHYTYVCESFLSKVKCSPLDETD